MHDSKSRCILKNQQNEKPQKTDIDLKKTEIINIRNKARNIHFRPCQHQKDSKRLVNNFIFINYTI